MATTTNATPSAGASALDINTYLEKLKNGTATPEKPVKKQGELGKDEFLTLLTTQLRYQDPMAPSDNQQMAAQMAQFSSLEQAQKQVTAIEALGTSINEMTAKQNDASFAMSSSSATSLMGQNVRVKQSTVTAGLGTTETTLNVQAKSGSVVNIVDAEGKLVRSLPLEGTRPDGSPLLNQAGSGSISWDGRDDAGIKVAPGSYNVEVKDSAGAAGGYAYADITVDGIVFDSKGPMFAAGGSTYRMSDLLAVSPALKTASNNGPNQGTQP